MLQVDKLAKQLEVTVDAGYTCETAGYFYLLHVLSRWERFQADCKKRGPGDAAAVADLFPFGLYFADAPQPLFARASFADDMEAAHVCWRHLETMFTVRPLCVVCVSRAGSASSVWALYLQSGLCIFRAGLLRCY